MTSQDRLDEFVEMLPEGAFDSAMHTMELFNKAAGSVAVAMRELSGMVRDLILSSRYRLYWLLQDAGYPDWLAQFLADHWPERWLEWALERYDANS